MKRILFAICVVILIPLATNAAEVSWDVPTYTDNTVIPAGIASTIVYTPFMGDILSGPWVAGVKTAQGILSATMPDPAPGTTKFYTVSGAFPGGPDGPKAVPASKTVPPLTPGAPPSCTVR
jgi:hypothetical protein